jgi:hypothetical protein
MIRLKLKRVNGELYPVLVNKLVHFFRHRGSFKVSLEYAERLIKKL